MTLDLTLFEEHFRISTKGSQHPLLSIPAVDLLREDTMKDLLVTGSKLVKGIGLELAVSIIGLSFFGLAATKQVVMSQYNRILDLSLDNLTLQLESHGDYAYVGFKISELKWTDLPTEGREDAIKAEWTRYFSATLNPLIEKAASAAELKSPIIWNQYGARSTYLMDYLKNNLPDGPVKQVIADDFQLLAGMPGETFNSRKNPFDHTPCYLDSPYKAGAQIILRSSCCMYYKRENGTKCYNCPILKEEARTELKVKIEAKMKEQSA